jgi:hypothetical protein
MNGQALVEKSTTSYIKMHREYYRRDVSGFMSRLMVLA